ncbi:MAG TPA: hypothetical protein DFS52_10175, partial [Myxococcales bacterium]|nr:hypothetical protein [Myxococcales bacterium]
TLFRSESQFFHVAENEGLPSLTLSLNGDPLGPEALDNFAFEVHSRFRDKQRIAPAPRAPAPGQAPWQKLPMTAARNVMKLASL